MPDAAPPARASSLLAPDEPPPVVVERAEGASPLVLVADHAGRRFPRATGTLGLAPGDLERHIAYDIGIVPVAREVARALDAPLVAQTYSRLVIDCNRPTDVPSSIPEVSETTEIPGNRDLPATARAARIDALFRPYHAAIAAILDARARRGQPTALIAMHSFTPVYMGASRPWQLGLLYNRDARLARRVLDLLAHDGTLDGRRQPALQGRRPDRLHLAGARRAARPAAPRLRDPPGPDRRGGRPGALDPAHRAAAAPAAGRLARSPSLSGPRADGARRSRHMAEAINVVF